MGTNVCVNLATVDNTATRETKVKVSPSRLHFDNLELWKQAENGLQSRSSENGKTAVAVWHYGLKLQ